MAQLFDFKKVTIGPRALVATVELAPSAPVMTSEDPAATQRVLDLMPGLSNHVCLGDAAPTFGEVVRDTELAHLLEHVTVELLAQSDIAGDVACGQTLGTGERLYEVTLGCPDDVLVAGALSSAAWIMQWAYSGGGEPEPDVKAIVSGLIGLVKSVSEPAGERDGAVEPAPGPEPATEPEPEEEATAEPEVAMEPEPVEAPVDVEPESTPVDVEPDLEPVSDGHSPSAWDMDDVPRPHLVR